MDVLGELQQSDRRQLEAHHEQRGQPSSSDRAEGAGALSTLSAAALAAPLPAAEAPSAAPGTCAPASSGGRKRGRGRPPSCTPAQAESRLSSYVSPKDGTEYFVNDCVYLEASKPAESYRIGRVKEFIVSKRDSLVVNVSLFYRLSEIPEQVYLRLLQDRRSELPNEIVDVVINHSVVRARELFQSEKIESHRASALRGKCSVVPFQDVYAARSFLPLPDAFFTTLHYNPDTRRLATIQGEIRIGASHQARLPECRADIKPDDRSGRERSDAGETLLWRPGKVCDSDVIMYLRAARSVAAFAGMCDGGGSASEGARSACRDDTTQSAMDTLHRAGYNREGALVALVKSPLAQSVDRRWSQEDSKKFMKGLRIYGKNFFKIRKELLPHRETCHLVEYYYYWKKLPMAFGSRPNARRRTGFLRRQSARPATSEEGSSSVSDESEFDGTGEMVCFKCDAAIPSSSKVWHQVDDRGYLCEDCSERYKKYGGRDECSDCDSVPEFVFRPVHENGNDAPADRKTAGTTLLSKNSPDNGSPSSDRELRGDSDPTSASSASSFSSKSPPPLKKHCPSAISSGMTASIAPEDGVGGIAVSKVPTGSVPSPATGPFLTSAGPTSQPVATTPAVGAATSVKSVVRTEGRSDAALSGPVRAFTQGCGSSTAPPLLPLSLPSVEATMNGDDGESDDSGDLPLSVVKTEPGLCQGAVPGDSSPPPAVIEQQCHASKNAMFFRVLSRRNNACARSDIIFKPPPDHSLARAREQRSRVAEVKVKEDKRDDRAERLRDHASADGPAQSSRSYHSSSAAASSGRCSTSAAAERSHAGTPRLYSEQGASYYPLASSGGGSCLTPALMHLGQLARPHSTASDDYARSIASMQPFEAAMQQRLFGGMHPFADLRSAATSMGANMPPDMRERLEAAAWKMQQDSTAGNRELFEMHLRNEQAAAAAAVAAKLSAGLNPLEAQQWLFDQMHLQRRLAAAGGMMPPGVPPHLLTAALPGYYQHAQAAAAAAAAAASSGDVSRERLSRLGYPPPPPTSESPLGVPDRLAFPPPPAHSSHTHTHTHVHVHQPGELAAPFLPPHLLPGPSPAAVAGPLTPGAIDPLAAALMGAAATGQPLGSAALPSGMSGAYMLPPGIYQHPAAALFGLPPPPPSPSSTANRDSALEYFGRQLEPFLAQQMQFPPHIQQEIQRQLLQDRDRHLAAMAAAAASAAGHQH